MFHFGEETDRQSKQHFCAVVCKCHLEGLVGVRGHRHGSACHLVLHDPGLVSS